MKVIEGTVWSFGDNVNTDLIVPGRYLLSDVEEVAQHVMEGIRPEFAAQMSDGDILVAGSNFGGGSSRELAAIAIKHAGAAAIVAVSFARIYFRNAINVGLPVVECPEARSISEGTRLRIDLSAGVMDDLTSGRRLQFAPFEGDILRILESGGLMGYLERKRKRG